MSEFAIDVTKNICITMDYEEYNLDQDQAEALLDLLADALGKKVTA